MKNLINKFKCWNGNHDLAIVRRLTEASYIVHCRHCNGNFGMNDEVKSVLSFDKDMHRLYKSIGIKDTKQYISNINFAWWWK